MSSDTSAPNFNFPEKQPSAEEKALIDDVLQLCEWSASPRRTCAYDCVDQLKPVSSAYARYSPDAVFHDPIGLAKGLEAVVSYGCE